MESKFIPNDVETKIYEFWENSGFFKAKIDKNKKPFTIILPPPNANADLHLGHAMYVYEDVMIRYRKIMGDSVLWLPGADHAGVETQFVFEKHLQKQGKSRMDYDRNTLFKMIWDFVMQNKVQMENQLRRLGFALDWSKSKFTLDPDIVKIVYRTFKQLNDKGLVYRATRLVNYCTFCGTSFSDLEVVYKERIDPLYYLKYGPLELATTRPETKFGDTAVAVHPLDKRYQKWIGQEIEAEGLLGKFNISVVADESVDPKFGTGVVKVTPAHDFTDFETGQRHRLEMKQVIGYDGKLNEIAGPYKGLYVNQARKKIVADLQQKGLLIKVKEDYKHRVGTCYKCSRIIEPLPKEQWFIKVKPLAKDAIALIKNKKIKIYPKKFEKTLISWLSNFHDWNISRQIVWGIRIPAFYCESSKKWFISEEKPDKCEICSGQDFSQDTDTFDTWFSSAQWPFATLESINDEFYRYFYPTSVMETGYDILPWWVARMIMIGNFSTASEPFKAVFLHGIVRDKTGAKMSKSKGNVINPLTMIDKYGADALRTALLFGIMEGGDVVLSEEKIIGMRNFANKVWNIGRFIKINEEQNRVNKDQSVDVEKIITSLKHEFTEEKKKYRAHMEHFRFSKALDLVYHFLWHRFADYYLEELKASMVTGKIDVLAELRAVYLENLKFLHPFAPFVTEAIWQEFKGVNNSILEVS